MRKRPASTDDLGQQMIIQEVAFGPGDLSGQPVLLMRCEVTVRGSVKPQVVTLGVPGGNVDRFLVGVQHGVAAYHKQRATELEG
jgi:hypothetical protein